jgi:epoxyqueuosine reductase QueG
MAMLSAYDKAGIAAAERLADAPAEYHPRNLMREFQSVIVLAREPPRHDATTRIHNTIATIAAQDSVIRFLKANGYKAEVVGSRATRVSLPRLGQRAGVGELSPFQSLAVSGHGLRTVLSAIITDAPLASTPLSSDGCPRPEACLKRCPALDAEGRFDRSRCKSCGACVSQCPAE